MTSNLVQAVAVRLQEQYTGSVSYVCALDILEENGDRHLIEITSQNVSTLIQELQIVQANIRATNN